MPKATDFGNALGHLFHELNNEWLERGPDRFAVTDERVLRELSLPPGTQTRLCYFSLPANLHSLYRELVFPVVDESELVPATGDEVSAWQGNVRAMVDSLLQRAHAVIGDVSTAESRVWSDLRAASQRSRTSHIAIIAEQGQDPDQFKVSDAEVFIRPPLVPAGTSTSVDAFQEIPGEGWLDQLGIWLRRVAHGASGRLEDEAIRLLEQGMYRPAVIAVSSALEVTLRERLQELDVLVEKRGSSSGRSMAPVSQLLEAAAREELITFSEAEELMRLQQTRNILVHSAETIDGRRARSLVLRTARVITRLRSGDRG